MKTTENKQKELAKTLHKRFCIRNHTEHCAWYYEKDYKNMWSKYEHKKWLIIAKNVIEVATYTVEEALKALKLVGNIEKDLYKKQK